MTDSKKDTGSDAKGSESKTSSKSADENLTDQQKLERARDEELAGRNPNVGMDGVNPITPNNPPKGSQPSAGQ